MNRPRRRALVTLVVFAVTGAFAEEVQVLILRYRRAEDVIPMLRPYLDPATKLVGQGNQLHVSATLQSLTQIRQLLAKLDRPPRWLTITVRQDRPPVAVSEAPAPNGTVVTDSRVAAAPPTTDSSTTTRTQSREQAFRIQEDSRAPLQIETAVPMSFRHFAPGAQGVEEIRGIVTYDAIVQFVVRPRLMAGAVTLEVEPLDSSVLVNAGERGRLSTTAQGRLGDWISVGGADLREDQGDPASTGNLRAHTRPATNQRGVWLKVELEPEPAR
jgi:hypothetical protein